MSENSKRPLLYQKLYCKDGISIGFCSKLNNMTLAQKSIPSGFGKPKSDYFCKNSRIANQENFLGDESGILGDWFK